MKAPFLLDNTFVPANNLNFEELSRQRQTYKAQQVSDWEVSYKRNPQEFMKDYTRTGLYWNFDSLNSLIKHYNSVGYNDVCNYPNITEFILQGGRNGYDLLFLEYDQRNSSGPNYKITKIDTIDPN